MIKSYKSLREIVVLTSGEGVNTLDIIMHCLCNIYTIFSALFLCQRVMTVKSLSLIKCLFTKQILYRGCHLATRRFESIHIEGIMVDLRVCYS